MSKIIRVPLEDNRKKILIPYPNGYNWQNSRVIPVPLGNDLTSIPPIIKLTTDGVYFIAFNANQWFDLLFIFFKIIQFLKYGKISLYTKYKEILRWKKN